MQIVDVTDDSVDGRNPKQPPGMYKTLVNNGEHLPVNSTGERRISHLSSISNQAWFFCLFGEALMFFPNQLPQLLRLAGYAEISKDHPFKGKETLVSLCLLDLGIFGRERFDTLFLAKCAHFANGKI